MKNYKTAINTPVWLDELLESDIPHSTAALYEQVPLVYRAVKLRADSISSVPIIIEDKNGNETSWPYPEPLAGLLWRTEASLLLTGAAYWEPLANRYGHVRDVKYRNPLSITVRYSDGKLIFKQGPVEWINDLAAGNYEMIYFAEYDPRQDLFPGVGAAETAKIDAQLLAALAKFPRSYFEGGAMPVTLLGIDTTDAGEIERIENWFKRSVTSIKNAFRVLGVRNGSITPHILTPPLDDLEMPGIWSEARRNIYSAFGIPESMVDVTAANYAIAREARRSYYEDIVMPRARQMYETVINQQLLGRSGLKLRFDFQSMELFQEDEQQRSIVLANLRAAGVPLRAALEIAGFELTEEQAAEIDGENPDIQSEITTPVLRSAVSDELRRYQRMAEKRVASGKPIREFESNVLPPALNGAIAGQLETAKSIDDVRAIFNNAIKWQDYP